MYLVSCWSLNPCGAVLCRVIKGIYMDYCTLSHLVWHVQFVEYSVFFQHVFLTSLFKKKFSVWICVHVFHFILLFNVSVLGPIPCCLIIQLCMWYYLNLRTVKSPAVLLLFTVVLVILNFVFIFIWRWICPFKVYEDYFRILMGHTLDL